MSSLVDRILDYIRQVKAAKSLGDLLGAIHTCDGARSFLLISASSEAKERLHALAQCEYLGQKLLTEAPESLKSVANYADAFTPQVATALFDLAYLELEIYKEVLKPGRTKSTNASDIHLRVLRAVGAALFFQPKNARCKLWLAESYSYLARASPPPPLPFPSSPTPPPAPHPHLTKHTRTLMTCHPPPHTHTHARTHTHR
jgi:hypothetical protein